ncbi:hypothetical protein JCM9140_3146 [Halalkalibacter wakoensis JCM 9140]|uniref:Acb2/Tad1 hairpin domain-containing protein n=1 Tax=Halalkalibacter wakoensis JCM 9140 TaxID=1236970 RepID=W4Q6P3_9BACI|nr:hypothetical protein [Halalkalibacter wakoensis]GAE27034.1 hypothetical protein JCM9140_3146 [Halalkalibacter wakoensis JCM 9140]
MKPSIENNFKYHAPKDQETVSKHEGVRNECRHLANTLDTLLPDSREKSLAMTKLEEVMMWANASIARN